MVNSRLSIILIVAFFLCAVMAHGQRDKFYFGVEGHLNFNQVEGDNLRGFNKVNLGFGLLGGYNFSNNNYLIFNPHYDIIGSNKSSEKLSQFSKKHLGEAHVNRIGLLFAYALQLGDSWTGETFFRFHAGLKYSRVISSDIQLFSKNIVGAEPEAQPSFKNSFNSISVGFGRKLSQHLFLDLVYEHALSSILEPNEIFSRFIPFGLSLRFNYTL